MENQEPRIRPIAFCINMGKPGLHMKRWEAYEKAAAKAGLKSLSEWAKLHLDKLAGYEAK